MSESIVAACSHTALRRADGWTTRTSGASIDQTDMLDRLTDGQIGQTDGSSNNYRFGNENLVYWKGAEFIVVGSESHYAPSISEMCKERGCFSDRLFVSRCLRWLRSLSALVVRA